MALGEISTSRDVIQVFMTGDVMTGRGIDQILPHPGDARIYESYMKDARGYIEIAEAVNGPIPKPASCKYIWGDALRLLETIAPDLRLINLETSITGSHDYWPNKGIHYKMHPKNTGCLKAFGVDIVALANNHVLDWGYSGLEETLKSLRDAGIEFAGAGENLETAANPAIKKLAGKGRILVFSWGLDSSGIPATWAARKDRPGVNRLASLSNHSVRQIKEQVAAFKQEGDIVIASIHWGGNWGYRVAQEQIDFAHRLIESAGIDLIHGHSSHHPRPLEVYRGKLILYGSGDFLNDYEGISGYEYFRGDLALMYLADIEADSGSLLNLRLIPLQIKKFRLNRASGKDALWLEETLNREGKDFGTRFQLSEENVLTLQ